jgi:hypothetical protein
LLNHECTQKITQTLKENKKQTKKLNFGADSSSLKKKTKNN